MRDEMRSVMTAGIELHPLSLRAEHERLRGGGGGGKVEGKGDRARKRAEYPSSGTDCRGPGRCGLRHPGPV
jgi:hypothetical protein